MIRTMASLAAPAGAPAVVARTRSLAVLGALALVVLGVAWELWLAPTGRGTLAVKVLPLALAVPGLWAARLHTYRWTSLVVWLYVGEGLLRATTERGTSALLASVEVALGVALFTACGVHIRARLRAAAT